MGKRISIILIILLAAVFSLFGETRGEAYWTKGLSITSGGDTHQYPARKGPYRIAVVNGFAGNMWRLQTLQTVKAYAVKPEIKPEIKELKVVSVGNDVADQIAAIDNFIAAGYDAILFIAINPTAFDAVIKRAAKAGTILVPFDNVLDTTAVVQVFQDNVGLGRYWAESLVKHLPKKEGKILEVRGVLGYSADRDRHDGANAVLKKYPKIKVIEVVGQWDTGTTQKVVADAIATHGKFDGFFCQYGTVGVINAMMDSKHPIVPVAGDQENAVLTLLAQNKIPGGTAGISPSISAVALKAAIALLKGYKVPTNCIAATPRPYDNKDLKPGVNYFPDLPPNFTCTVSFPDADINFTPAEIMKQTAENQ
ncbi:MAG: sugar ABC transporter substrate-binding protein [Spirochaetes bacterium]|nr:sugar ABC transporter substrate-binding protein [Spirochaetota bacterium]